MNEIWKDVQDYEGRYLISNTGKLKSIINNREILMNGSISNKGYLQYSLNWKLKNKKSINKSQLKMSRNKRIK